VLPAGAEAGRCTGLILIAAVREYRGRVSSRPYPTAKRPGSPGLRMAGYT